MFTSNPPQTFVYTPQFQIPRNNPDIYSKDLLSSLATVCWCCIGINQCTQLGTETNAIKRTVSLVNGHAGVPENKILNLCMEISLP